MKEELIFATDPGDNVHYYGKGHDGLGLYVVGAGDGNFFEEATKSANTFEEFFIDGRGIGILKGIIPGLWDKVSRTYEHSVQKCSHTPRISADYPSGH